MTQQQGTSQLQKKIDMTAEQLDEILEIVANPPAPKPERIALDRHIAPW